MTDNDAWLFQASKRTSNGDLINIRGNTPEQFNDNLLAAVDSAALIQGFFNAVDGVEAVVPAPAPNTHAPASNMNPNDQFPPQQPQANTAPPAPSSYGQGQGPNRPVVDTPQGGIEVEVDKWGGRWTYGHPQAPQTQRGPAIIREWKAQSGKMMKRWADPAAGPRWFAERKPKVEKEQQWPGDWCNV